MVRRPGGTIAMAQKLDDYARYALYWAPERDSPLARFGAAWLGWDAERGEAPPPPEVEGLPLPREDLAARPSRYGFHATLKNPFRLAETSATGLDHALRCFAARARPVLVPSLSLDARLGFVALRPSAPTPQLDTFAAACVRDFHRFAAPPGADELARRRARSLSAEEERNLVRWAYPYVMGAFRFHLTLTCTLPSDVGAAVVAALGPVVAPLANGPVAIRSVALFGEPGGGGNFRLLRRYALAG